MKNKKIINTVILSGLSLSLLTGFAYTTLFSDQNNYRIAQAAPIPGSSTVGGANSVNMNKVYLNGSSETENLTVAPNGTVTVRVKYDNTGTQSVTDATIKDSLPAGFTYVSGSIKNCITPSFAEELCDVANTSQKNTMFNNLTGTGMSPVAGLYDAASPTATGGTDPSATSGILEIGKKRYLEQQACYYNKNLAGVNYNLAWYYNTKTTNTPPVGGPMPDGFEGTVTPNQYPNQLSCNPAREYAAGQNYGVGTAPGGTENLNTIDMSQKRYLEQQACVYGKIVAGQDYDWSWYYNTKSTNVQPSGTLTAPGFESVSYQPTPAALSCNPATGVASGVGYTDRNNQYINTVDMIGRRYLEQQVCRYERILNGEVFTKNWYYNTKGTNTAPVGSLIAPGFEGISSGNQYPNLLSCNPARNVATSGGYNSGQFESLNTLDFLDATRGKGYVEYKMTAPTTLGTFGTGATMQDGGTTVGANDLSSPASDAYIAGSANSISVVSATILTSTQIGTGVCSPSTLTIGVNSTDCTYPLTGDNQNKYDIPLSGIKAKINTSNSTPVTCSVINNGTATAQLQCLNIPSMGATAGTNKVVLSGTGITAGNDDVTINLVSQSGNTLGSAINTPIAGQIGSPMPNISLSGSTTPNGTLATFTPQGGSAINGSIQGGQFIPFNNQNISTNSMVGSAVGVLSVAGLPSINIPTNFRSGVVAVNSVPTVTSALSISPLTAADFSQISLDCGKSNNVIQDAKTKCTFSIPNDRSLPNDFKMGVGNVTPGGYCTIYGSKVTCFDVPVTSTLGNQLVYVQIGNDVKISTGKSVTVVSGIDPTVKCEAGKINQNSTCVPCPVGFYCDGGNDILPCPSGMTTLVTGARSSSECVITTPKVLIESNTTPIITTTTTTLNGKSVRTGGLSIGGFVSLSAIIVLAIIIFNKYKQSSKLDILN